MLRYTIIFSCILFATTTCLAQSDRKMNYIRVRTASYSDSTRGFMFLYDETKNAFEYHIYNHIIDSITHVYCGTFETVRDTLYLNYSKGNIPADLKPFLIREFSGSYYIQYFDNGTRKFLWKQPRTR